LKLGVVVVHSLGIHVATERKPSTGLKQEEIDTDSPEKAVATERKPSTGLKHVETQGGEGDTDGRDGEKTQHGIETETVRPSFPTARPVATERKPSTGLKPDP